MRQYRLSEKQRAFIEEYMTNGGNATAAARTAGYKHPHPEGTKTLQSPTVAKEIDKRIKEQDRGKVWDRKQIMEFWTDVASGKEGKELAQRLKASELLAKAEAMFVQKVEVSWSDKTDSEILDSVVEKLKELGWKVEAP